MKKGIKLQSNLQKKNRKKKDNLSLIKRKRFL